MSLGIQAELARVGDASHLEFRGTKNWNYQLKKVAPNRYHMQIPALDEASVAQLNSYSDPLISQVEVSKDGNDGTFNIYFTVQDEKVESFDYQTDEPSRLILDFYRQNEPKAPVVKVQTQAPNGAAALPAKRKKVAATTKDKEQEGYAKHVKGQTRKPAGDEILTGPTSSANVETSHPPKGGAFDAADPQFNRLMIRDYEVKDEAIIASRENFYIRFPILKMPVSQLDDLAANLPEFVVKPRDDRENKEVRFLISLYEKQISKTDRTKDRMGAFMKVYDHFLKTYPESEYEETVKNLAAHMHFLRWKSKSDPVDYEASLALYKYLAARFPESPLNERIRRWIAYAELERGNGLATIQEFQNYLSQGAPEDQRDQAQKALAEGYLILKKYDDALSVYEGLAKNSKSAKERIEAVYRLGDVAFQKGDWAAAVAAYTKAIKTYPEMAKVFPNALYNLGEAQFWQRNLRESLDSFVQFLSNYSEHPFGGYAMTRAGEILEALGADRSRVIGAFLESYFRYRGNPGAEVARVRMLSQQMKGMKEKELRKAREEMKDIAEHSPLPTMDEFVTLMGTDGLQRRGDNQGALEELIAYYQSHPTSGNLGLFKSRIVRNISEIMGHEAGKADFMAVLNTQAKYSKTWLKNSDRLDVPYFVARAYELAGVQDEANKLYQDLLIKRAKIKGSAEEKERKVHEMLPSVDTIKLRQAAIAIERRDFPEAFKTLQDIKSSSELSADESVEKVRLMAEVASERGDWGGAKTYLRDFAKNWKGEATALIKNQIQLADLELKSSEAQQAEKSADQVLQLKKSGAEIRVEHMARALELKGQALEAQGKNLAAVEAYQQLLEDYSDSKSMGAIRYRVGDILFNKGDHIAAEKVWLKLDDEKDQLFKKLARERLNGAQWQTDHKRYLQRIPAMAGIKGG